MSLNRKDLDGEAGVVVAYAADLMFGSRIRGAAQQAGVRLELVPRPDALVEACRTAGARLVLVDLDRRSADVLDAVRALKADDDVARIPLVAFVSHVDAGRIAEARAAGADRVLARSAFVRELPKLLGEAGAEPG